MIKLKTRTTMSRIVVTLLLLTGVANAKEAIVHDAEYAIIEVQNGEAWAADDKAIDQKLAEIRKNNGNKPPNIVYILLDDVGFGEIGMDELSVIRGYKTPKLTAFAKEGLSLQRAVFRAFMHTDSRGYDDWPLSNAYGIDRSQDDTLW